MTSPAELAGTQTEDMLDLNTFMRDVFRDGLPLLRKTWTDRARIQRRPFFGLKLPTTMGWVILEKGLAVPETTKIFGTDQERPHTSIYYVLNDNGNVGWAGRTTKIHLQEVDNRDRRFRQMDPYNMVIEPTREDLAAVQEGRLQDTAIFLGYKSLLENVGIEPAEVLPD